MATCLKIQTTAVRSSSNSNINLNYLVLDAAGNVETCNQVVLSGSEYKNAVLHNLAPINTADMTGAFSIGFTTVLASFVIGKYIGSILKTVKMG